MEARAHLFQKLNALTSLEKGKPSLPSKIFEEDVFEVESIRTSFPSLRQTSKDEWLRAFESVEIPFVAAADRPEPSKSFSKAHPSLDRSTKRKVRLLFYFTLFPFFQVIRFDILFFFLFSLERCRGRRDR